jgi:hypothetical protein
MSEGGALINLGNLTKPATVLIEKVSGAIGLLYEPTHVRRMARAEAYAREIAVRAELSELEQRAMLRFVHEERRNQANMETVTAGAISVLPDNAQPERLDDDWLAHFFDRCRLVSNKEMQTLWSKILAGEANNPGTISRRTIDLVATLTKEDALLFTALCGFVLTINGEMQPAIFDLNNQPYIEQAITSTTLMHLDDIGLIRFAENVQAPSNFRLPFPKHVELNYFGQIADIMFRDEVNNQLPIGRALLTRAGMELAPLSGSKPVLKFLEYAFQKWRDRGDITVQLREEAA